MNESLFSVVKLPKLTPKAMVWHGLDMILQHTKAFDLQSIQRIQTRDKMCNILISWIYMSVDGWSPWKLCELFYFRPSPNDNPLPSIIRFGDIPKVAYDRPTDLWYIGYWYIGIIQNIAIELWYWVSPRFMVLGCPTLRIHQNCNRSFSWLKLERNMEKPKLSVVPEQWVAQAGWFTTSPMIRL